MLGAGASVAPLAGGEEAKEKRSAKMICVTIEIREGATTRRAKVTTSTIERALELAGGGKPGRRVRLVFPIEPEAFFATQVPGRQEAA
jgi:hypothetical protein